MKRTPPILIALDPKLNRKLRKKAAAEKRTLRFLVETALTEFLNKDTIKEQAPPAIRETVAG